jgi:hypothetical protein
MDELTLFKVKEAGASILHTSPNKRPLIWKWTTKKMTEHELKVDKWIRQMVEQYNIIEPFIDQKIS